MIRTGHPVLEQAADLAQFRSFLDQGRRAFVPQSLTHVYLRLDFKPQYENATTARDARDFLRSIYRAALAAHRIAERYRGFVQEVQGSMVHIAVPALSDGGIQLAGDLHEALGFVFDNRSSRVMSWRMAADTGKTLIVANRGAHGDDSYVALGQAANRPAKHLYSQLELAEEDRQLKQFHLARFDPSGRWSHQRLGDIPTALLESKKLGEQVRHAEPQLYFAEATARSSVVTAQAAPIAPIGRPGSPEPETPHTYFGWVMRADLDGFTARVDRCMDDDEKLAELAQEFNGIMDAATSFVHAHKEVLVQLPWAGDNFTVAAAYRTKDEYDSAVGTRLVELTLDFEKEMRANAVACEFGGWAHGVAGGEVHGNSGGNVYVAGIGLPGRRFLVGVGEGFGRSTQAFGDIDPEPGVMVLYQSDWRRLNDDYKSRFAEVSSRRGKKSSIYVSADIEDLWTVRGHRATRVRSVSLGDSRPTVAIKPYFSS